MRFLHLAAGALAVLPALAGRAHATDWTHPSGFQFWLPDDYQAETDDATLTATDPGGEINLVFFAPPTVKTLQDTLAEIDRQLARTITDVKIGPPRQAKVNGLDAVFVDGSGKASGVPLKVAIAIYQTDGRLLLVFGVVRRAAADKHLPTVTRILSSMRYARPGGK